MKKSISFLTLLLSYITLFSFTIRADEAELSQAFEHATPSSERMPAQVISRPSVMPTGIFSVDSNVGMTGLKVIDWTIGTKFGIVKNWEGQFSYDGLKFNEFKAASTINLGTKYNYLSVNHISGSFELKLPIHIAGQEIVQNVKLGLPTIFYNEYMAGGILHNLLDFTMRPNIELGLDFPWWYGYQVYGNFWAAIDGSFGNIKMNNPNNQARFEMSGFWQKLPLNLEMIYAFNNYVDLIGNFGFNDTFKAKETMKFGLGVSLRGGRIFG